MPQIGTWKLYFILQEELQLLKIVRDKLFRILKDNHILIKPKKRCHITTDSRHRFRKHKNQIKTLVI
jgi:phage antirepressor YoqD-like protein